MDSSIKMLENTRDWARALMANKTGFFIVDTETTGFRGSDEIVEMSVINHLGVVLLNERFKPINPIPPEAIKIHGISNGDVAGCRSFGNLYREIYDVLRRREIVFFNAAFDLRMIDQTCQRFYLPPFARSLASHCAMLRYRRHFKVKKGTLIDACTALGIPVEAQHSALGDALLTLEVVKALAEVK